MTAYRAHGARPVLLGDVVPGEGEQGGDERIVAVIATDEGDRRRRAVAERDRGHRGDRARHHRSHRRRDRRDRLPHRERRQHLLRIGDTIVGDRGWGPAAMIVEAPEPGPVRLDGWAEADVELVEHLRDGELLVRGQGMADGREHAARFASQHLGPDAAFGAGEVTDGDVDLRQPCSRRVARKGQLAEAKLDVGMGPGEGRQQRGLSSPGAAPRKPNSILRCCARASQRAVSAACPGGGHRETSLLVEHLPGGGQRDSAGVAVEQLDAEFGLELRHRLREGGLGEVQSTLPRW